MIRQFYHLHASSPFLMNTRANVYGPSTACFSQSALMLSKSKYPNKRKKKNTFLKKNIIPVSGEDANQNPEYQ